jgi:hypothetical protein
MKSIVILSAWLGACVWWACLPVVAAEEPPASAANPAEDSAEAKAIDEQIASLRFTVDDASLAAAFEIPQQPLLSYSDPARGYAAAGLWRVGKTGRPLAYVGVEYWNAHDRLPPRLSMEFLSMIDTPFELSDSRRLLWSPQANGIEFHELTGPAAPAANDRLRLRQMKAAIQRFSLTERLNGEPYQLRLLPNPIDRYDDPDASILDAAAFAFAYGTNPEALVLIECDAEHWRFGVAHTSSAEVMVSIDNQQVLKLEELTTWEKPKPHSADWYEIINGEYVEP